MRSVYSSIEVIFVEKSSNLLSHRGEGSIASDSLYLVDGCRSESDEAVGEMGDGHLIFDDIETVVSSLIGFD